MLIWHSEVKLLGKPIMIVLTNDNLKKYLIDIAPNVPAWRNRTFEVLGSEEINEETYVNYIFRVFSSLNGQKSVIYLRQTRDHLKASPERKLPADRIQFEVRILRLLDRIKNGVVPKVLYLDEESNVAFLTDIKRGSPLLVTELLKGKAHPQTGAYFGEVLATYHAQTLFIDHALVCGTKEENEKAVKFHQGMRLEPALKMFPSQAEQLLKDSNCAEKCLVLGDLTSKNIFVDGGKVRFLDLERAFIGDPAFDLGYLFAHYLTEIKPENIGESLELIGNFMKSYRKVIVEKIGKANMLKMENRVIRFLGAMILFRFFGLYFVVSIKRDTDYWKTVAGLLLSDTKSTSLPDFLHSLLQK